MDRKLHTKAVFLKHSWPPKKEEDKKKIINIPGRIKISPKNQITKEMKRDDAHKIEDVNDQSKENPGNKDIVVMNDIYDCSETNNDTINRLHATIHSDVAIKNQQEDIGDVDPRKSFVVPDDFEPYETKVTTILNKNGAACKVLYLHTIDTERLTGPETLRIAVYNYMDRKITNDYEVEFLVNRSGITLTDVAKKKFFRKHFPRHTISYCDVITEYQGVQISAKGMFAFVGRKLCGRSNECHLFRQVQSCEPAKAVVNFINTGFELPKID